MDWLTDWNIWLACGFLLLILETLLPGIYLMWWGIASIIVSAIVVTLDISVTWQFIYCAVFACLASFADWCYQRRKDRLQDQRLHLNQRNHAMLGKQGRVVEILDSGAIRAKFGDTTWKVEGNNLAIGDLVKVINVQSIVLIVEKVQ